MRKLIKDFVGGLLLALYAAHTNVAAQERPPLEVVEKICQWEARTAEHVRANKLVGVRKMDLQARMGMEIQSTVDNPQIRKEMQAQVLRIIDGVYNNGYVVDLPPDDLLRGFYITCLQGY